MMSNAQRIALAAGMLAIFAGGVTWAMYDAWIALPKARKIVADLTRDPEGTQFRNDSFKGGFWHCGEVNAKNGSGGYVGFQRFISSKESKEVHIEGSGLLTDGTNEYWIAILDKENASLEKFLKLRESKPGIRAPSRDETRDLAVAEVFEDMWKSRCIQE